MFTTARLKLTGWYLLIIMLVSGFFSVAVYRNLTEELNRSLHRQALRIFPPPPLFLEDTTIFDEAKDRIVLQLLLINTSILVLSGFAAYFLAGKTLKPIETMVEDQKRFVSDASHELRTPLTALKTEIEVALRDPHLKLTDAKSLLTSNLEEVDKMQSLSNYLLSLNRYQNSTLHLSKENLDFSQIVTQAIAKVAHQAEAKKITLTSTVPALHITANSTSLSELLLILLDNAVKYTHHGGNIHITAHKEGKTLVFSVKDSGVGIKSSDLPYIFNRFYRADASRGKVTTDGYGLGLSIAKSIVDLHHGHIHVDSVLGQGTTFIISLPSGKTLK
jgi:two-component system, OmpR family, sensor histidine kinase CiaH